MPEGGTATFNVKLSAPFDTAVSVARSDGDTDISVQSGSTLTFTTSNWDIYQAVTLIAEQDADVLNGTAIFTCSSPGLMSVNITAPEVDNDTTLTVATTTGGTVNPSGSVAVTKGVARSVAATQSTGYYFNNWTVTSGSATIANANAASTTATISNPATVRANFLANVVQAWTSRTASTVGRELAVSGVAEGLVYIATGWDNGVKYLDCYSYNPSTNAWTKRADFPYNVYVAAGGAVAGKLYVGTGINDNGDKLSAFYVYNPSTNTWTSRAAFGGGARYYSSSVGCESNGLLYMGLGDTAPGVSGTWHSYNPSTNAWTTRAVFGGAARRRAACACYGTKIYIMGGDNGSTYYTDLWEYNTANNTWTQKADYPGGAAAQMTLFGLDGYLYGGTGINSSGTRNNKWYRYNVAANTWSAMTNYPLSVNNVMGGVIDGGTPQTRFIYCGQGSTGGAAVKNWYRYTPQYPY